MNKITVALLLLLLFAASSFAKKEQSAKGENLLLQLETNFAADVAKHGHDAFLTYFAEDGVEIVDGGGINDKEAMRKQPPWPEGTSLTWTPVHAEMASKLSTAAASTTKRRCANNLLGPKARALPGRPSTLKWRRPAISATPTAITSTPPKIKRASSLPTTASTPRSGRSRRTANGRWSSTWETPAPTQKQGSERGPSQAMRDPHRAPIVERMAAIRFVVVATSIP